jgi:hypothetical protein
MTIKDYFDIVDDVNNHQDIKDGVLRIIHDFYNIKEVDCVEINKIFNDNRSEHVNDIVFYLNVDGVPYLSSFATISYCELDVSTKFKPIFKELLNKIDRKRKIEKIINL